MKKLQALFYALACIAFTSCLHNDNDIGIKYNESEQYYSMKAYFSKSKMRDVEEYMDKRIGAESNLSFANTQTDALLTLDDHTTFYMKKYPGHIEIKLDKDKNSNEAYRRIKSMCEGFKKVFAK